MTPSRPLLWEFDLKRILLNSWCYCKYKSLLPRKPPWHVPSSAFVKTHLWKTRGGCCVFVSCRLVYAPACLAVHAYLALCHQLYSHAGVEGWAFISVTFIDVLTGSRLKLESSGMYWVWQALQGILIWHSVAVIWHCDGQYCSHTSPKVWEETILINTNLLHCPLRQHCMLSWMLDFIFLIFDLGHEKTKTKHHLSLPFLPCLLHSETLKYCIFLDNGLKHNAWTAGRK